MLDVDVVIIGAGASGLMCAIEAGKRGRRTLVLDHANKAGKKIISLLKNLKNSKNYIIKQGILQELFILLKKNISVKQKNA